MCCMTWRYVDLFIHDQFDKRGKSTIERLYSFVDVMAAQEVKIELSQGLQRLIAGRDPLELKVEGEIIGSNPLIGKYNDLKMMVLANENKYFLTLGSRSEKKESSKANSEVRLSIATNLSLYSTVLGRMFLSYLRTVEDGFEFYRQSEISPLFKSLQVNTLFELQREFGWNAHQVLAALDAKVPLEQLTKELMEQKRKR